MAQFVANIFRNFESSKLPVMSSALKSVLFFCFLSTWVFGQDKIQWHFDFLPNPASLQISAAIEKGWHLYALDLDPSIGPVPTQIVLEKNKAVKFYMHLKLPPKPSNPTILISEPRFPTLKIASKRATASKSKNQRPSLVNSPTCFATTNAVYPRKPFHLK